MVMPPGHGQELAQMRPLRRREKLMAGGIGGVLVLVLAVVLVISLAQSGHKTSKGCIAVSLAYSTGGTMEYHCGAAARRMCADVGKPGLSATAGHDVAVQCRKADLAVG